MEWGPGLFLLLAFAACPLMMVFCFFRMRMMGCSTESARAPSTALAPAQNLSAAGQLATLQAQLNQLQFEQMAIARQIDELTASAAADPVPAANGAVASLPAGLSV